MGIWVRSPKLLANEVIEWRVPCNWTQGGRACGGVLWITTQALLFEPNRVDAATGGEGRRVALKDVQSVGVELPDAHPLSGGLRRRVRLDLVDGRHELFLINKIEQRLPKLESAVARAK